MNTGKSGIMVGISVGKIIVNSRKWSCGLCGKRVQANSVKGTACKMLIHCGVRGSRCFQA